MSTADTGPVEGRFDEAEAARRIEKLTRINAALMDRMERSIGQQETAFSLFQTAIALENEVRARTDELKNTLGKLERSNQELLAARDAAERADRSKTGFFTAVGHDLLQPLHAARLTVSTLIEMEPDGIRQHLVSQIDHALSTIEELLKTILDLSKLEAGVLRPSIRPVRVSDIFASVALDLEPLARSRGIALRFHETDLAVRSDPLMLRRIIQNLVANSVRYTEQGGILVLARRRGGRVRLEVWDTGPGIPASERERIFDEFQRGTASERTGALGLGLGLSIVRRMAEALDHSLSLVSQEGRGTCFMIAAEQADSFPPAPAPAPGPSPTYGLASARVVVVENEDSVIAAMKRLLERWTCETRVARHLGEVDLVAAEADFRPDIVLADYHLDRGECGIAAIRRLREVYGERLPAIVITADHTAAVMEDVRSAQCEIMRKPVKPAELRALISHLLG